MQCSCHPYKYSCLLLPNCIFHSSPQKTILCMLDWWFKKGKKHQKVHNWWQLCSLPSWRQDRSSASVISCRQQKQDLFNVFIMKYLFKRNVQVEPAQWRLGIYLRKRETADVWCRSDVCEMIMYIFTAEDPSERHEWAWLTLKTTDWLEKIKKKTFKQ